MERTLKNYLYDQIEGHEEYLDILSYYDKEKELDIEIDYIISTDKSLKDLSNHIGKLSGAEVVHVQNIDDVIDKIPQYTNHSLMIIGYYSSFKCSNLHRVNYEAKKYNIDLISIVTGKNKAHIAFNILKNSKFRELSEHDASIRIIDPLYENIVNTSLGGILTEHFNKSLIIPAHSDGIHLNLTDTVVCGSHKDDNVSISNQEYDCTIEFCRKKGGKIVNRINATDIKTESLYMLTCNGFSVNSEMFATSSSLINGFLSGYTKEIVTTTKFHEVGRDDSKLIKAMIESGYNASFIAWILNDLEFRKNSVLPYISVCFNLKRKPEFEKIKLNSMLKFNKKLEFFDCKDVATNRILAYRLKIGSCSKVFIGSSVLVVLSDNLIEEDTEIKIKDGQKELEALEDKLESLSKDINNAKNHIAYVSRLIGSNKYIDEFIQFIDKYTNTIDNIHNFINNAKYLTIYREYELESIIECLRVMEVNLDKLYLKTFVFTDGCSYCEGMLKNGYYKKTSLDREIANCSRCNSELLIYDLISSKKHFGEKKMSFCPICGVNYISNIKNKLSIRCSRTEKNVKFDVDTHFESYDKSKSAYLIFDIIDKSNGSKVHQITDQIEINKKHVITLDRPMEIGNDLHTYKCILIYNHEITYYRGKFEA